MASPVADVVVIDVHVRASRLLAAATPLSGDLRVPTAQMRDRLAFLVTKFPSVARTDCWLMGDAVVQCMRTLRRFVELLELHGGRSGIRRRLQRRKILRQLQSLNDQVDAAARVLLTSGSAGEISSALLPAQGLVELLYEGSNSQQELALRQLRFLALDESGRQAIADVGGIDPLLQILRVGVNESKELACRTLRNLACDDAVCVKVGCVNLGQLVELTHSGPSDTKEQAAGLLQNLAFQNPVNASAIALAGGVDSLTTLVTTGTVEQREVACAALRNLAIHTDPSCIVPIVEALGNGSSGTQKENALALLNTHARSETAQAEIISAGAIPLLVELVLIGSLKMRVRCC